jgi:heat shock protein HtpX
MSKRIFLFVLTNLAVVATISVVLHVLGIGRYIDPQGRLDLPALAAFCLVWGMGGSFISLQISRWMAKRSLGVRLVDGRTGDAQLDWLHATVAQLAERSGLPMPEVGVYDSPEVNAFATGPSKKRALVAVSSGLLRRMQPNEAAAVLGHEVAHVANGDMVTMSLLQGVINAFVMFLARVISFALASRSSDGERSHGSNFMVVILLELVLGFFGSLIVFWYSRQREFRADAGSAGIVGKANMIAALRRLANSKELVEPEQAQLASFKIAGRRGFARFLSTHPPLEERIAALEAS